MTDPYHQRTRLRVRGDECDGTRHTTAGKLFALVDDARFDLYDGLTGVGVVLPARHAAKAERFEVQRFPGSRESIVVEAWIARVGRTSLDVAQRVLDAEGNVIARIVSTLVALGIRGSSGELSPTEFDATLHPHAHAPLDLPLEPPEAPNNSLAFLRTVDAWPSHENQGRHLARTRMIDWLDDVRRMGVDKGAFDHAHASDAGPLVRASFVYELESRAGDGLRIAMATHGPGVFDATIVRGREVVTRARLRTA